MKMNEPRIELAVLRTVAYADVFDYPLRPEEIHRYLVATPATLEDVCAALAAPRVREHLEQVGGYLALRGRGKLVRVRRQREQASARLWPDAVRYGRVLAGLPFVRMVAVTGSLAVSNVDGRLDLDYLIVTQPGRLWVCRGLAMLLVHWAVRRGVTLCPNYLLAEDHLELADRSLYTAHELAQMHPLSGTDVYRRLRALNAWAGAFLPNAYGPPPLVGGSGAASLPRGVTPLRRMAEGVLTLPGTGRLEQWEMRRKIRKLRHSPRDQAEVDFGPAWCKGHFEGHGQRALAAYEQRVGQLRAQGVPL